MTRILSNKGYTISVIDERSEIACMYNKVPQMDVGIRTDVINKCPKHIGIKMAIRSLAPDIIVVDEIGKKEDIEEMCIEKLGDGTELTFAFSRSLAEKNKNFGDFYVRRKSFRKLCRTCVKSRR